MLSYVRFYEKSISKGRLFEHTYYQFPDISLYLSCVHVPSTEVISFSYILELLLFCIAVCTYFRVNRVLDIRTYISNMVASGIAG